MIEPISFLTVIGLSLAAFILLMQQWIKFTDSKKKEIDDEDKKIDGFSDADSIMRDSK